MDPVRLELKEDVAVLRMEHGKASALDLEMCAALVARLDEVRSGGARAAVLTGTGSIFSAGVDLLRLLDGGASYLNEFVPALSRLVRALFGFPKPLVAAVNGHAVAGGCVMACTADHRVMAAGDGRIGVPEVLVGVPFPTAALEAVRFVVPPQHFQDVVYRGATYAPEDARALGLVDEVVSPSLLLDRALAVAHRLAEIHPDVFALTKREVRAPAIALMDAGAQRDNEVERIWKDDATLERVRNYVERTFKRPSARAERGQL